jgi:stage II sporulation protein D
MRRSAPALATLSIALLAPASADAASRLVIQGGGFGHGVGMSQYGTLGFAKQGRVYRDILRHYYSGTQIGKLDANPTVRVLLQANKGTVVFSGASQAGDLRLQPGRTYTAQAFAGDRVVVRTSGGRRLRTAAAPLRIIAPGGQPLRLGGAGAFRGALELRPGGGGFGLNAINAVDLESYVRGVVSAESPSSWPAEALKTQAVAARTYAITTNKPGAGFDHYPDTRSQVYRGVAAETPSTDAAVAATDGEVVTHQGKPVVTYFFSTSGGRTENAEFGFPGGEPKPWLKSVADPFDKVSPRHRWTFRFSTAQAGAKLRGLVKGRFLGIDVVQRGVSPRVVKANVIGTNGSTAVDGPTLRRRFGLYDTWATFTVIDTDAKAKQPPADSTSPDPGTGGVAARGASVRRDGTISGRVIGPKRGTKLRVERRTSAGAWRVEVRTHVGRRGRYSATVSRSGVYRVVAGRVAGPTVRIK